MTRDIPFAQPSSIRVSRRTIVATGARLAYAAPLVAASLQFSALGAGALDSTCTGFPLDPTFTWVFDPNVVPVGAPDSLPGYPGCCSCGPIPGATYYPTANYCCPAGFTPNPAVPTTCIDSSGTVIAFVPPLACVPISETGVSGPA